MLDAADIAIIKEELESFMTDLATVTRDTFTKTGGDSVPTTAVTVATNVKCRIMPLTEIGNEKTRLIQFPAALVERAEYFITLQSGYTYKDHDTVTVNGVSFKLIAVRYDHATWVETIRAIGRKVE